MNRLQLPLERATTSTFEELTLLWAEDDATSGAGDGAFDHAMRVRFHGAAEGFLEVRASRGLMIAAAANMLGDDNLVSHELGVDALGEVANVICGNVLPEIAGSAGVFRLDSPATCDARANVQADARCSLTLDGGRVEVLLVVDYMKDQP
jgi:CheY-specific phosphatase CheX